MILWNINDVLFKKRTNHLVVKTDQFMNYASSCHPDQISTKPTGILANHMYMPTLELTQELPQPKSYHKKQILPCFNIHS
jgi:hypothetical protein